MNHEKMTRREAVTLIAKSIAFAELANLGLPIINGTLNSSLQTSKIEASENASPAPDATPLQSPLPSPSESLEPTPSPTPMPTPKPKSLEVPVFNAQEIVWAGDIKKPYIYLTVDDCWDPAMAVRAMNIADKYKVRLTFFPIGRNVARTPSVYKEAVQRGHAVENHTWSHEWLSGKSASEIEYQILKQHEAVQNAVGKDYPQHFLRPPAGAGIFSTEHPWPLLWQTAQKLGYKIAMWTSDSNGWRMYPRTDQKAIDYIMKNVNSHFYRGTIVLQHALPDDMIALPKIIQEARANHWQMITMPQGIR